MVAILRRTMYSLHEKMRVSGKEWTWQDVAHKIKFTDKPISHSLIRFESSELDKLACEAFVCEFRFFL